MNGEDNINEKRHELFEAFQLEFKKYLEQPQKPKLPDYIMVILGKKPPEISAAEIYELERMQVELLSDEQLKLKASRLLDEMDQFGCVSPKNQLFQELRASLKEMKPPELVQKTLGILEALRDCRISKQSFERRRSRLGILAAIATLIILIILSFFCILSFYYGTEFFLPLLTLGGALGSSFSYMIRLHSLFWIPGFGMRAESSRAYGRALRIRFWLSMMIGTVSAAFFLAIIKGKLIEGSLFPAIKGISVNLSESEGLKTFALCFAWSIVAGFSERLVPDKLSKLAGHANPDQET